jgi:peptide/nickel transport system substrate-binding protein
MNRSKTVWFVLSMLIVASMVLSACAPAPTATPTQAPAPAAQPTKAPEPTKAAEPTKAPEATKAPEPTAVPAGTTSKDPTTMNEMTFGDPETLDPAHDYETAGSSKLRNIYEGLVDYKGADANQFVPKLAEAIPDPVKTADGGVQYVWKIKDGVKFHNGDAMTAEDVAFSFWRTLLVNDNSADPGFLLSEAFFTNPETKNPMDDATELVDPSGALISDKEALAKADPKKLEAACEKVKNAVQFDNAARTVTMNLDHPWGPFIPSLASNWAYVTDKKWVAENGEWDGDCKTWQNFYGITSENQKLRDKTNGTGPYMMEKWTPGEQFSMVVFPDYWGPKPTIQRWVEKQVNEFGTRFASLQAGDADRIALGSQADWAQMDTLVAEDCDFATGACQPASPANPNGILRRYTGLPTNTRTDIQYNWKVAEGSGFIGSGKLDGQGVPPDFFSDIHVRKAFNYCFDYDTYIKDVFLGEGEKSKALSLPGQIGYEGSPPQEYDLQKCADEFKASTWKAEDGTSLWDTGFYMQLAYNAGNTGRQSAAEILAANLQQVNPNFFVAPVAMPWPAFLQARRAKQFAVSSVGWAEDINDPHNWYVPYLLGTYASQMSIPADVKASYQDLITQGVAETDPEKRAAIYQELNTKVNDLALYNIMPVAARRHYEPLYLNGWYEALDGINRNMMVDTQGSYVPGFSKK